MPSFAPHFHPFSLLLPLSLLYFSLFPPLVSSIFLFPCTFPLSSRSLFFNYFSFPFSCFLSSLSASPLSLSHSHSSLSSFLFPPLRLIHFHSSSLLLLLSFSYYPLLIPPLQSFLSLLHTDFYSRVSSLPSSSYLRSLLFRISFLLLLLSHP